LAAVLVCVCGPVTHQAVAGAAVCPVVLLLCRWPPPGQRSQAAQWWLLLMCALLGLFGAGGGARLDASAWPFGATSHATTALVWVVVLSLSVVYGAES